MMFLLVILAAVLFLPFLFKKVEHNIEIFLLMMGLAAAGTTGQINSHLCLEAIQEPIPISLAVLFFSLLFRSTRRWLDLGIQKLLKILPLHLFLFLVIFVLGLLSSIITAIIASLVLVEVISILPLNKKEETHLTILACFAIGLGAALTPIGEPLSTITLAKLKDHPDVNFWFLLKLIGPEVLIGVAICAILSFWVHDRKTDQSLQAKEQARTETLPHIFIRTGKVFLFISALIFLGEGFKPLVIQYILPLSSSLLYWINISSAVLDNATLAAAEISTAMSNDQIRKILMGLLIAGGMLIPGNIPNIIAASKLKIGMKDWARFGVPLGLILMTLCFIVLSF